MSDTAQKRPPVLITERVSRSHYWNDYYYGPRVARRFSTERIIKMMCFGNIKTVMSSYLSEQLGDFGDDKKGAVS